MRLWTELLGLFEEKKPNDKVIFITSEERFIIKLWNP